MRGQGRRGFRGRHQRLKDDEGGEQHQHQQGCGTDAQTHRATSRRNNSAESEPSHSTGDQETGQDGHQDQAEHTTGHIRRSKEGRDGPDQAKRDCHYQEQPAPNKRDKLTGDCCRPGLNGWVHTVIPSRSEHLGEHLLPQLKPCASISLIISYTFSIGLMSFI